LLNELFEIILSNAIDTITSITNIRSPNKIILLLKSTLVDIMPIGIMFVNINETINNILLAVVE
ncbi:hypothetical protein BM533_17520, partial [Clostridioides difficile]